MKAVIWECAGYFLRFGSIFAGIWLGNRLLRMFLPALKMLGFKPWD